MGLTILSIVCTLAAWVLGTALEMSDGWNIPGFGVVLAVTVMGGFIMAQLTKRR